MAKTVPKDTIKEKLESVIKTLAKGDDKDTLNVITELEGIILDYEDFRKVAEYMSGLVESLTNRFNEVYTPKYDQDKKE